MRDIPNVPDMFDTPDMPLAAPTASAAEHYLRTRSRLVSSIVRLDAALDGSGGSMSAGLSAPRFRPPVREQTVSRRALDHLRSLLASDLARLDGGA